MRITLIHNPKSGDEDHSRKYLTSLIREAGHDVAYKSTKENFADALENPGDLIVIAGGDGTVRKVALQMPETNVPIAILPMGTANNISKSLGISGKTKKLIAGWNCGRRQKFTLGQAKSSWSKDLFVEGVGQGLFSRLMSILDTVDDKADVDFSTAEDVMNRNVTSLIVLVSEIPPIELKIKVDAQEISGPYLFVEITNIQYVGPSLLLAPEADPGDSYLDCVFLHPDDREGFAEYLTSQMSGKDAPSPLKRVKARSVEFEWEGHPIHLDDRIWTKGITVPAPSQSVEVKLSDRCLEFLVPSDQ